MKKTLQKLLPLAYGGFFNSLSYIAQPWVVQKAFTLFVSPRKGKILPHQQAFLQKATAEVVEVEGLAIQTYTWPGTGPTVLLFHGWESNAFRWRKLIEVLRPLNYHIIALDAPAHGASSGKVLHVPLYQKIAAGLMERFRPQFAVGHSMGGMMLLYHQHLGGTESLKGLVVLGAPADLNNIMKQYKSILKLNKKVFNGLDELFKSDFNFRIDDFSVAEFSKSYTIPGLLVHDKKDLIVPYSSAEKIARNWKTAQLITTEGHGHSLHQKEINEAIGRFMTKIN
jgi:pimeloyl-ACP methyl ester carboxylesterase